MQCTIMPHRDGSNVLGTKDTQDIEAAIKSCPILPQKGSSEQIRDHILSQLTGKGWSGKIKVDPAVSRITIPLAKNKAGLCIQTAGNMARMYADLLKLQVLYIDGKIEVGALVLPTRDAARKLGDNVANTDRLQNEMGVYGKVIHMPIVIFSFE